MEQLPQELLEKIKNCPKVLTEEYLNSFSQVEREMVIKCFITHPNTSLADLFKAGLLAINGQTYQGPKE